MSGKHLRTLAAVFERPTRVNVPWREIETMLKAVGATVVEGRGSRIRVELGGQSQTFHRPHPQKEADPAAVRSASALLQSVGVTP